MGEDSEDAAAATRATGDPGRAEPVQVAARQSAPDPAVAASAPVGLAAIYERHHGAVFRAAYRVTGNTMDAEDVLQTVFARLMRRRQDAPAILPETAGSYLHRAAVNAALDLLRSRRRMRTVELGEAEQDLPDESRNGPEENSRNRELSRRLRAALTQLPPRQGEIFALRYLEGMGNLEISRLLGSSQTAIAVILHRARRRLQNELRSWQGDRS
jgi:RNA polymerase sigma-70 factor (ECF subfamily)